MKKILPFALAPLSLMIAGMALAAETALPETVVTADRSLAGNSSQLDAATVITRADIERTQPDSLASLLSRAAGVSIPANGGPLTTTGVFIRGFKSNQVLILVDGVRVNDANQG
ncbi:TonB-dependent receptor, partial [Amnimonas aquatica]